LDGEKVSSHLKLPPLLGKKLNKKRAKPIIDSFNEISLYFIKGERYKAKATTIREWMEQDRKKQNFFDSTPPPQNIRCSDCGSTMKNTVKSLDWHSDQQMRILYFFECPSCKKRKGVYNTGENFIFNPDPCDKCSNNTKRTYKRKGNIVTTIWTCPYCKHIKKESEDYTKTDDKWEKEQMEDKKLLEKFRSVYCFSENEGQEYIEAVNHLNMATKMFAEKEKKEQNPAYRKAKQLKKLNVVELEMLISKILEKDKYDKLIFEKPEIDRFVVIPFTLQDADSSRIPHESTSQLKKVLNKTLENTNWRLMSDGVEYRLGYLHGRLKGYEREEDLMKIVKK
jgi:hypothetical protein